MRLRSLLACATTLAVTSAVLSAAPALQADTTDTGDPIISPALVTEIAAKTRVRSIIQLKPGQNVQDVASDLEQASDGARVLEAAQSPHFFVAEVDGLTLDKLKKDARVQSVYKDELRMPFLDASTALIRSVQANQAGWTGAGTTVAVLDTGIDRDHPFFSGRIADEACFSSSDASDGSVSLCPNNQPSQTGAGAADAETAQCVVNTANACSHGSHVAGIAAGRMATGAPANGVAPAARILPIQVFSRIDNPLTCAIGGSRAPCFLSYTSDQKLALEYVSRVVRTFNVAAVNMSLGGGGPFVEACDADPSAAAVKPEFDTLASLGVAPVVAAGNNGFENGVSSPACISTAVTVGATDDSDALASFTNRGPLLDLFAPGVGINASVPDDGYGEKSGTSMSAPHVAGAFALMRQAYPDFTVAQSLQRLRDTGRPIQVDAGGTPTITARIDMERATTATRAAPAPRT
ncbi:Subtilase family protein [Nonomuraea solani]|uniref:Subtilase family protein n=1 Tax=Nonomuraea solani TaxID=1144553 RepID=A0A1H6EBM0_9ACTN|nr:S8 family serine peptidase [Nonomuraea solani]SEG94326.1 Subtilase family protein [Nonomuraea solani]